MKSIGDQGLALANFPKVICLPAAVTPLDDPYRFRNFVVARTHAETIQDSTANPYFALL